MKKTSTVLFILMLFMSRIGFSQERSKEELARDYRVKAMKFENRKQTGLKMMIGGGLAFATGVFLIARAEWREDPYNPGYYITDDPQAGTGALIMVLGAPLTAGGITLNIIGRKNAEKYNKKARELKLGPNARGIGFTYRF